MIVKLGKEEEEGKIFQKKYTLMGTKIFVDEDLTRQERLIQKKIREKIMKRRRKKTEKILKCRGGR